MAITLPLDEWTVEEKLAALEAIWSDLSRNPDDIPVPQWHLDALAETEERVRAGEEKLSSLAEAKKRLLRRFE